ncbi:protein ORF38 [Cyprinid herpesvirus 3]|uniref:ORF38L n=1 Tax=Cyprinid herpesvirus 3 TaxID=180230 RepID=A3QMK7_CYHV3|nr:unnamed protein product [Cyprinid herpesvirus 3]ABC55206.1 hypothetical protein [Cyprinid herpesvirus 3]ABG42866.1 protein ORF38 [Cyprinid herpesvirus 3]AIC32393.1 ORF38L [Cyprinid herpesvirus 3]AJP55528.1 protein ORF38 [Cyprinid herpesvirus 3]AJP55685.1 protein ORF38 [Cyprinid herpesvirus 3]
MSFRWDMLEWDMFAYGVVTGLVLPLLIITLILGSVEYHHRRQLAHYRKVRRIRHERRVKCIEDYYVREECLLSSESDDDLDSSFDEEEAAAIARRLRFSEENETLLYIPGTVIESPRPLQVDTHCERSVIVHAEVDAVDDLVL